MRSMTTPAPGQRGGPSSRSIGVGCELTVSRTVKSPRGAGAATNPRWAVPMQPSPLVAGAFRARKPIPIRTRRGRISKNP